jgi:hypothetical protein
MRPETYLIVGRRGSGKTALAQYFSFQKKLENAISIEADRPDTYQRVLVEISGKISDSRVIAIPQMRSVWDYVLWSFISKSVSVPNPADETRPQNLISQLISHILHNSVLGELFGRPGTDARLDERMKKLLTISGIHEQKARVLNTARKTPIIITLDTLEQYDINDKALMYAMAALVEYAASFNLEYSSEGIHLKVLMSGEVLPHLEEEILLNTLKSIRDPVYLFWRPKDLLRLICWRFYRYLETHGLLRPESKGKIDWTDHHEVLRKMWNPYFGEHVTNFAGKTEQTFPYVLRHTQMRPRQLIVLCNSIAKRAQSGGRFPTFSEADIRVGVRSAETVLAVEIINSFSCLYPQVGAIVDALRKMPKVFLGNELDRRAKQSASEWPVGTYSPSRFRRLVTELGIVGLVARHNEQSGFIDADFEYSIPDRLLITHRDECVIHPMFYSRLAVEMNTGSRVMPFTTDRD